MLLPLRMKLMSLGNVLSFDPDSAYPMSFTNWLTLLPEVVKLMSFQELTDFAFSAAITGIIAELADFAASGSVVGIIVKLANCAACGCIVGVIAKETDRAQGQSCRHERQQPRVRVQLISENGFASVVTVAVDVCARLPSVNSQMISMQLQQLHYQ